MTNAVTAFRQISWLIVRWALIISGSLIAIGVVIGGIAYGYNWYNYERHIPNVQFIVELNTMKCADDKFPIHVLVGNNSERTVEHVSFTLSAKRPGRSTDLTRYHSYDDDHILAPKRGFANCWAVPELTEQADFRNLQWGIKYKTIRFKD